MSVETFEYVDVKQRAAELGCNAPIGLAILPRNFDSAGSKADLVHQNPVPTIRVLWRRAGLTETRIEQQGDRFPFVKDEGFGGWLGPVIFVGSSLLKEDADAVSRAIGVIADFLTGWYAVVSAEQKVKLDIVVERHGGGGYRHIEYLGDVEGLRKLPHLVLEIGHPSGTETRRAPRQTDD